jgi:hypothetical protein
VDRSDNFPGTIVYYYEITQTTQTPGGTEAGPFFRLNPCLMKMPHVCHFLNSHSYPPGDCLIAGDIHQWPEETIIAEWSGQGDVVGCGILVDPEGKLAIFFTLNGKLIGQLFRDMCGMKLGFTDQKCPPRISNFISYSDRAWSSYLQKWQFFTTGHWIALSINSQYSYLFFSDLPNFSALSDTYWKSNSQAELEWLVA